MNRKFHIKTDSRLVLSLSLILLTALFDFSNTSTPKVPVIDGYQLRTIVLDAGHGGKDPGCHGNHALEKDVALAITLEVGKQLLAQYPDVKIVYTRDKDVFIPLHERAALANRSKADLFISIHCNYIGKRNKAKGTETYVMGLHRAEENLNVAKRENASILMEADYEEHYDGYSPDSPEGHIILSMYQHAHLAQSILLAQKIESNFARQLGRKSRGVKQAGFLVLRKTTMPSVLIETGFLSTDEEEDFLSDPEKQVYVANSILNAITGYKGEIEDEIDNEQPVAGHKKQDAGRNQNAEEGGQTEAQVRYKVQVAASVKYISPEDERWSSLPTVSVRQEADFYKYLAGDFKRLSEAKTELTKIKNSGFKEAFVVAYLGENRISFDEALKIAKAE